MGDGLSRLYDEETHVVLSEFYTLHLDTGVVLTQLSAHYTVPQLSRSLLIHETLYRPQSRAMGMDHVDFSE